MLNALKRRLAAFRLPAMGGSATSLLAMARSATRGFFSTSLTKSTSRIRLAMLGFGLLYAIIGGRLLLLGVAPEVDTVGSITAQQTSTARPILSTAMARCWRPM